MNEKPEIIALQQTQLAYGISNLDVPPDKWRESGRYKSVAKALWALANHQQKSNNNRPCAWSHHHRLIALVDIPMRAETDCPGHIDGIGHPVCCSTSATITVAYLWRAGEALPDAPEPAEWQGYGQCPNCHAAELQALAEIDSRISADLDSGPLARA